ncbi:unnamed protein product [Candida verbasci]|uniref:Uncharacterized protein n=1 Tax=Candida verbasci TaxID=1227364 RepID=A0A9W4TUB0_9ASCO|nr:unnamed protein product [Candida verbasci]
MPSSSSSVDHGLVNNRMYHPGENKIIQCIKLPNEKIRHNYNDLNSSKITIKVKMSAINYLTDFNNLHSLVIPSFRIIGKLTGGASSIKYLVWPFTNCQVERSHTSTDPISITSNCCCNLTYGVDLNGGFQEFITVPKKLLIPIHKNVSLHDVCFIFDILLPFYINIQKVKGRTLVLLNDIQKEMNEILIILDHFKIKQNNIVILDEVDPKYKDQFDTVFCFNPNLTTFAEFCCTSTGLTSTKQRYTIHTTFPIIAKSIDKSYNYIKLTYEHKLSCIEVLKILFNLNSKRDEARSNLDLKVSSTNNSHSNSTSSSSSISNSHYSWIWYDKDVDLVNHDDFEEDEEDERILDEINQLIIEKKLYRVGYFNRRSKKEINACII